MKLKEFEDSIEKKIRSTSRFYERMVGSSIVTLVGALGSFAGILISSDALYFSGWLLWLLSLLYWYYNMRGLNLGLGYLEGVEFTLRTLGGSREATEDNIEQRNA